MAEEQDIEARIAALRTDHTSAKWRAFEPDVLPAWIAEMDLALAPAIAEELHAAIDRGDTGYRWNGELPEALVDFHQRHTGWAFPVEHVLVLQDVLTSMAEAMRALTGDSDCVVITPPIYPPFFSVTRSIAGRGIVEVPLVSDTHGHAVYDIDGLASAFARPEVTGFLLCHPHNPTGHVADVDTLRTIGELARKHGVTVISDEIWAPLTWGDSPFVPYLSIDPDLTAPDVALVSASKAFNLAGLKCAQLVAGSREIAERLRDVIPVEVTYGTGHLGVIASIAAYRSGDDWLAHTVDLIAGNMAVLERELAVALPEIGFDPPTATYLAWLDCRSLNLGDDPAAAFLEHGRIALNAGNLYGHVGDGFVRVNVATQPQMVTEMVRRMSDAVASIRR
jgi:cystathionine beta-lyase